MAEGIAFSIVGKLAEYTVDPVLRQIKYLFFFNSNIQDLRNKVQELENKRNDVKLQVGAAERNNEIIGEEVSAWLLKVDDLKEKAHEVLNSVAGSEMRCLFNRCPNLKSRYLLSRRATKKTIEADKLKVEGTFERVSYPRPPVQVLNLTSHQSFETRLSTKEQIKEALKDKDISIIGICGMPGVVKMSSCNAIRSLFPESVANRLVNLQILFILKCVMLEEVVSTDARENEVTKTCKMLEFPKLKKVRLVNLSRFKSFTSQSNSGVVHQTLFNQVNFPNMDLLRVDGFDCIVKLLGKEMPITSLHKLTDMRVLDCSKLLTIAESDSIQLLQNLERLRVRGCNALEVLFDFEGINVTNDDAEINMLGRLTSLWLRSLPKLVHITRMVPKEIRVFQNLKNLNVYACENLRYLFSPSIANSLVVLDFLKVSNCESIEEIIGKEEEGTLEIKTVEGMKTIIVFPNMKRLQLEDLSSIQMFCSQNYELVFPSLEDLTIEQCPEMKKLSPRPLSAPKLSKHTREHYHFFDISDLLDESGM
ncbi:unnamed protein product [Fraxinus pennsylvanica]|uniref:Disease resistance protein At4g27190-like leucine-rich repeats domain-containing protein n=1 Tax=Fraxinus pennsylvanica TaxID=56036 RepID=A0AAD2DUM8_9LAMI|nr:unnamed protein product [Fraxinus pennsylvanica]